MKRNDNNISKDEISSDLSEYVDAILRIFDQASEQPE